MGKNEFNEEEDLLRKGWIKLWIMFDVQSNDEEFAKKSLKEHTSKMKKESDIVVKKESFGKVTKVDAPEAFKKAGIGKLYSQIYEAVVFIRNFEALINFTITYAPSALEVLAPEKIVVKQAELQNAVVSVADMMHKFAQSGIGGVIISGGGA